MLPVLVDSGDRLFPPGAQSKANFRLRSTRTLASGVVGNVHEPAAAT